MASDDLRHLFDPEVTEWLGREGWSRTSIRRLFRLTYVS